MYDVQGNPMLKSIYLMQHDKNDTLTRFQITYKIFENLSHENVTERRRFLKTSENVLRCILYSNSISKILNLIFF